jgi:ABC-2 type transport system ATP-binding protein
VGNGNPSSNRRDVALSVQAERLTKRFPHKLAVDAVTFAVEHGSVFGLLGRNGAGKSSTIKMLTTLSPISSGTASVAGFDVGSAPVEVRRHIGYVPQMPSADVDLTGYENLLISAKLYRIPRDERDGRIRDAFALMGLEKSGNTLVRNYSGGMMRRLEIAQAMLHHPDVLFLDEPTVGLDPLARHAVWDRIGELRTHFGTTIFLTTHYMDEATKLCDHVAFLHDGTVAGMGTPAELCASVGPQADLDDVFIALTRTHR